jgi:Winged helix DNA-binding domain
VRHLVGVQAQAPASAWLALRARSSGFTASDADRAREREREIVRTWALRGTLHLVATEDTGWLLPLLAPVAVPQARRRLAQLGVSTEDQASAVAIIRSLLAVHAPLTRGEITAHVRRHGIVTNGQAGIHLIRLTAILGHLCLGPNRDAEPTYVLLRDWIGPQPAMDRDLSLRELARRYLACHGPADPADLAAWAGVPLRDARVAWVGIEDDLREVSVKGKAAWVLRSAGLRRQPRGVVRLIPSFDPVMLGWRGRELVLPSKHTGRVFPGGGWLHPVVLVDGRAAGTWRLERQGGGLVVEITPFEALDPVVERALRKEAHDIGRFLGTQAEPEVRPPAG